MVSYNTALAEDIYYQEIFFDTKEYFKKKIY